MIRHLPHSALAAATALHSAAPRAAPTDADAVQQELAKLQGTWKLVYWLDRGEERPTAEGIVLSFAAERFTIHIGGVLTEVATFEVVDPDRTPKAFDYEPTELDGRPVQMRFPAIYLVEGDVFIACIGYGGKRPAAFTAEAGSQHELVIYKRVKG
jgi:uncharacterized protein (TIGR03067 family)